MYDVRKLRGMIAEAMPEIIAKVKQMAEGGDLAAIQLLLEYGPNIDYWVEFHKREARKGDNNV